VDLYEIILKSSESSLLRQRENGAFPEGHNGPWYDQDTPVRNTAHWTITLHKAYEISYDERFLRAAISACDYLLSKEVRPYEEAFFCRKSRNIDGCNGLIGQVWALEPLIIIVSKLQRREYLDLSQDVLIKHDYDTEIHLWRNLGVRGQLNSINKTFNQQLWLSTLAYIIGKHCDNNLLLDRTREFFNHLNRYMKFLEEGLIQHNISLDNVWTRSSIKRCFQGGLRDIKNRIVFSSLFKRLTQVREVAIGYLPIILYGFALMREESREEDFWQNRWFMDSIKKVFHYVQSKKYYRESFMNKYTWKYNPIGFEIAYALYVFRDILDLKMESKNIQRWIELQIKNHYSFKSGLMERNTDDPNTLSSRIYEATRLPNINLNLNSFTYEVED